MKLNNIFFKTIILMGFLCGQSFAAKKKALPNAEKKNNTFEHIASDEKNYDEFLKNQSKVRKQNFTYNKYENIISGSAAFLIGNVGFFTTNSTPLSLAYSGIQTIGIVNVGRGAYELYRPDFEENLYQMSKNNSDINSAPQNLSKDIVRIFAEEHRAKRLALLYTSTLLTTQYFANAMVGNQASDLKGIYYFLGSVNLIVVAFALLHKDSYESFYYSDAPKKYWSINLLPFHQSDSDGLVLNLAMGF